MVGAKMEIRTGTSRDNARLAVFGAQTFCDSYAADTRPEDLAAYVAVSFGPKVQAAELAEPGSVFLIAEDNGQIVGYARLKEDPPPTAVTGKSPIELERIYTSKAWIGKGAGSALMKACINEANKRGCDVIWLGVWERNTRAQLFYQKWGFTEVGTQTFRMGEELHRDVLVQRLVDVKSA